MKAWVDSSFDNFRKVAGIGIYIEDGSRQKIISNWIPCRDNNYGELYAIYIGAILTGGGEVYTDSETAIDYIKNRVLNKPRTPEQYRFHQKMRLLAYKIRRLHPTVEKVKAHSREVRKLEIGNAVSDLAAKQGLAKYFERENNCAKFVQILRKESGKNA